MTSERRAALRAIGVVEISAARFFGLTEAEERLAEFHAKLATRVRELREGRGLSQREMAQLLKITQSRVVAIEQGKTSIEALARALIVLGGDISLNGSVATVVPRPAGRRGRKYAPKSTGAFTRPPLMAGRKRSKRIEARPS